MARLLFILTFAYLFSCSPVGADPEIKKSNSDSTAYYLQQIAQLSKATGDNSFPVQYLTNDSIIQIFLRNKFNSLKQDSAYQQIFLNKWSEPDISDDRFGKDCYRLTWVGAFDKFAYVIRIENSGTKIKLTAKKIRTPYENGSNVNDVVGLVDSSEKVISKEQWIHLSGLISDAYFWDMTNDFSDVGYDGSWWTLEGVKQTGLHQPLLYNKVTIWSPNDNSFRAACEYILKLSGLNFGGI